MATSGRYAIALALEHMDTQPGDIVLVPAYHCEAMIAPVKWICAKPVFYCINKDTSVNLDDIKRKMTANVKAIIVTHYFGFLQDLTAIRTLCDQHGIKLIEDCAHAFFGLYDNYQPVGKVGDYTIASSMKFLPVYEGGILCSETINVSSINVTAPSIAFQLKSLLNTLEGSLDYNRLGNVGKLLSTILVLKDSAWTVLKKLKKSANLATGPSSSDGGYDLDDAWVHKTVSLSSKIIIKLTDMHGLAHRRRDTYQKLHAAFARLPNSRPLFEVLPIQIVPWVYPLYVNNPEKHFHNLKNQGVPIWRFGEFLDVDVNEKTCPVSVDYSRHVFQFPCHQSLTDADIDWMINKVTQALAED